MHGTRDSGMGFSKITTSTHSNGGDKDTELIAINFNSSDGDNGEDIIILRNKRRDALYYFHDLWRMHPRMCGALVAIILICLPISIAFGVIASQQPNTLYKWVSFPMWIESNAAYSSIGVVATDDARCSRIGVEIMEKLGYNQYYCRKKNIDIICIFRWECS